MNEFYLKILQLDRYSTIEEIKTNYRKLAKQYHPDLHKGIDPKYFRELTVAYDWLIINHKPFVRPPPKKDISQSEKFFRVLKKDAVYHTISLMVPEILENDIVIFCMLGQIEFRVALNKDTKLPTTIQITNLGVLIELRIESSL